MSKPVKEMIISEYQKRFDGMDGALVIDIRGVNANDNNAMRLGLRTKNVRVTVVKNSLAKKALSNTSLAALDPILSGPAALAYGGESVVDVARLVIDWAKKIQQLELRGAVLDGELFSGKEGVKRLSQFPTRDEAQARVVQLILSPAGKLVGCALAPGSSILGIVKEIQDRLEAGKSIAKVG